MYYWLTECNCLVKLYVLSSKVTHYNINYWQIRPDTRWFPGYDSSSLEPLSRPGKLNVFSETSFFICIAGDSWVPESFVFPYLTLVDTCWLEYGDSSLDAPSPLPIQKYTNNNFDFFYCLDGWFFINTKLTFEIFAKRRWWRLTPFVL